MRSPSCYDRKHRSTTWGSLVALGIVIVQQLLFRFQQVFQRSHIFNLPPCRRTLLAGHWRSFGSVHELLRAFSESFCNESAKLHWHQRQKTNTAERKRIAMLYLWFREPLPCSTQLKDLLDVPNFGFILSKSNCMYTTPRRDYNEPDVSLLLSSRGSVWLKRVNRSFCSHLLQV